MVKRKTNSAASSLAARLLIVLILALVCGFTIYKAVEMKFLRADYFFIKTIVIDPSLRFINKNDLIQLRGKSIFTVDLKKAQRKLAFKYPQVANIRINKRFPDTLYISADQRLPFAQTRIRNKIATLDDNGVVLSTTSKENKSLPYITGLKVGNDTFGVGLSISDKNIIYALKIIKSFQGESDLSAFDIEKIDIDNLSEINLYLSNHLRIILDQENTQNKVNMLGLVLTNSQFDLKEAKYIDLRFKEPIIGKK